MSKMKLCKTCKKEIAKSAKVCPYCGAKNKRSKLKIFGIVTIIFIIFIAAISSLGSDNDDLVDVVKTGYLGNYKSVTVAKVLETDFSKCTWTSFESQENKNVVQADMEESLYGYTTKIRLQFEVHKDNTFKVIFLKLNDKPLKEAYDIKLELDSLYNVYSHKTSDKSISVDIDTTNDTLQGMPNYKYKK
ncbi:MAG: zinc ribbon domain-containing protein [Clostridium sp.]|uniref:hypothetical protein n=1 Tax=Clostridium sp. TaxID=1506 RepID=UPI0025BFBED7|nr:hypothetical protein [Clostridium sp.]MCH3965520.1 zinc ribbon domain-containing protein [Clostridium sp.]MCI1716849.1 zinc ribbon domain-containing protein [Clostridium sp.]MCI1801221.1 zinc ribbon domain-containing protein [Clostridium sp.]MCI1815035.1 zinc ribbon domain-containing protein [Clostridium sp.]MCI1871936.1 zinc ribbon domain-containing protein [Clostridium sp.]